MSDSTARNAGSVAVYASLVTRTESSAVSAKPPAARISCARFDSPTALSSGSSCVVPSVAPIAAATTTKASQPKIAVLRRRALQRPMRAASVVLFSCRDMQSSWSTERRSTKPGPRRPRRLSGMPPIEPGLNPERPPPGRDGRLPLGGRLRQGRSDRERSIVSLTASPIPANALSSPFRQRSHPASIPQEVAGSSRPRPGIPARAWRSSPALAGNPRLFRASPDVPRPACHAGGRGFESRRSRKLPANRHVLLPVEAETTAGLISSRAHPARESPQNAGRSR